MTYEEAFHEAAHAVLFAYAGFRVIWVEDKKCCVGGEEPRVLDMLAGAFAGFTAEKFVFNRTDEELMRLTRTDFGEIHTIVQRRVSDLAKRDRMIKLAREASLLLVMRFKTEIGELAKLLKEKGEINSVDFEELEYIIRVRALGILERLELEFEELGQERRFSSPELQERANRNPLQEGRKQYLVKLGGREAAYLSFDVFWPDQVNLYEVFVARELRNYGVGSACIRFAVELTKKLGKPKLTVRPRPLSEQPEDELIAWYLRRGFSPMAGEPGLFEIEVAG